MEQNRNPCQSSTCTCALPAGTSHCDGALLFPMSNLLTVLPDFDVKPYSHILVPLEKALVSTADLLTLDAIDVARRAQVPPGEVKKLSDALLATLHSGLNYTEVAVGDGARLDDGAVAAVHEKALSGEPWNFISTLDDELDAALRGGIAPGYLTEIVGERYIHCISTQAYYCTDSAFSAVGKTQFLLSLLLSVQLPSLHETGKTALYISTEAPLQTTRLKQILDNHPKLSALSEQDRPSLSRIQSSHIHDVEAQEHILRYQVPVAVQKHNVGLVVIDSIAANYRAEFDRGKAKRGAESLAKRSSQLVQLGALLRDIARKFNVAVVVANQVADRFTAVEQYGQAHLASQGTQRSRPVSPAQPTSMRSTAMSENIEGSPSALAPILSTDDPLALDHQQRFFTGWGDDVHALNLKTPSLGLAWTTQLATRIALHKEPIYEDRVYETGEDRSIRGWTRTAKVVFSAWCPEGRAVFEIWEGGIKTRSMMIEQAS